MTADQRDRVRAFLNSEGALAALENRLGRPDSEYCAGPWVLDPPADWRANDNDFAMRWVYPGRRAKQALEEALVSPREMGRMPSLVSECSWEQRRPDVPEGWTWSALRWELASRPGEEPHFAPVGIRFRAQGETHDLHLHIVAEPADVDRARRQEPDACVLLCPIAPLQRDDLRRPAQPRGALAVALAKEKPSNRTVIELTTEFEAWLERQP